MVQVPKGRSKRGPRRLNLSGVPPGLLVSGFSIPALKRWAIVGCSSGTADLHGEAANSRKALGLIQYADKLLGGHYKL